MTMADGNPFCGVFVPRKIGALENFIILCFFLFPSRFSIAMKRPDYLITCGRGGIGRRAALRSLWGNTRGGSSPLDRTKTLKDKGLSSPL